MNCPKTKYYNKTIKELKIILAVNDYSRFGKVRYHNRNLQNGVYEYIQKNVTNTTLIINILDHKHNTVKKLEKTLTCRHRARVFQRYFDP